MFTAWLNYDTELNPFTTEKSIDDNTVAIIEFRNGIRATFHTNCCSELAQRTILIIGSEGSLQGDVRVGSLTYARIGQQRETITTSSSGIHGGGDDYFIDSLITKMSDEENSFKDSDILNCFISTVTCLAIDEAQCQSKVVDLEPIWQKFEI
eukprot:TRINITY_DN2818_c0_g1_i1.p5 TRINITY_DN2818_c0_g1~~TRINITY_DN2818_c0_g1_i1.p5  ORF type:complete len:152 (-),score=15.68 TRINITY_DN2818_c0_g1_i1:122-577(-)